MGACDVTLSRQSREARFRLNKQTCSLLVMFMVGREVARYCTADFLPEVDLLIVARLKLLELAALIVIQSRDTIWLWVTVSLNSGHTVSLDSNARDLARRSKMFDRSRRDALR
jgi:hypothetical protein